MLWANKKQSSTNSPYEQPVIDKLWAEPGSEKVPSASTEVGEWFKLQHPVCVIKNSDKCDEFQEIFREGEENFHRELSWV